MPRIHRRPAAAPIDRGGIVFDRPETETAAAALARGDYQRRLLDGSARWSGGDLRGAARRWSGRYYSARQALRARIESAGFVTEYRRRDDGPLFALFVFARD
jgi:hypothetical protein